MKIIETTIDIDELNQMAKASFGSFVKAVVDIRKGIMAVDAELHSDEEAYLINNGSDQADVWGINLYPEAGDEDFIEFDSMINIRPSEGNLSRGIDSSDLQELITNSVKKLIKK